MTTFSVLLIDLAAVTMAMIVTWFASRKLDNYSLVDPIWALTFAWLAAIDADLAAGWGPRRALMLILVAGWSLRLGFFLSRRFIQHHPHEDKRYTKLRSSYAPSVSLGFLRFFLIQGVSVVYLAVPFVLVMQNREPAFSTIEIMGAVAWLISVIGEATADHQMSRFKADPANRARTCDVGLWRYSRHPNYFFECCIWVSFYLVALGTPGAWFTAYAPISMIILLVKVTGVPMAEAQSLESRGDEYRSYQRRTSMLIPWFPKEEAR